MEPEHSPEMSVFLAAIEKPHEEQNEFLNSACEGDEGLRERVNALLAAHRRGESFLERPVPGLLSNREGFAAGLAATFGPEASVLIGCTSHSVLASLSKRIGDVPHITLYDSQADQNAIVKTESAEIPKQQADSRYQLIGEIGRGGMGAILKGRDKDLGRDLAIKVLLDSHRGKPEVVQRFVEEAQIGGQLQHPGIVPVYELGQFQDERPFFTMKLIKGDTLAALLAKRDSVHGDLPKLLGIFEQVCQTMAYAHSKKVIHRDLKPSNIMVGAFGEVQVMDWGLSKVIQVGGVADEKRSQLKYQDATVIQTVRSTGSNSFGAGSSETQHGSIMGTPAYMPPEQAHGYVDRLDARADVFGLGAILAEILSGKPPYVADNSNLVFRMAGEGKLDECFTRLDGSGADPDLIAIAKASLEPDASKRLKDAGELCARITTHLEGVQERLRRSELDRVAAETRVREERRRRKLYMTIAGLLITIITGAGMFALARVRHQEELAIKEAERRTALDSRRLIELKAASEYYHDRDKELSALLAVEAFDLARPYPALRPMATSLLIRSGPDLSEPPLARLEGRGWDLALSPDGRWLLAGANEAALWDMYDLSGGPTTLKSTSEGLYAFVRKVGFTGDGRFAVMGENNGNVQLWELTPRGPRPSSIVLHTSQSGESQITALAASPDGRWLAAGNKQGVLKLWDLAATKIVEAGEVLQQIDGPLKALAFSHDSRWLASGGPGAAAEGGRSYPIRLWSMPGRNENHSSADALQPFELKGHTGPVLDLSFTVDDSCLVSGSDDKTTRMWSIEDPPIEPQSRVLMEMEHPVHTVATSGCGRWIASGSISNVSLWRIEKGVVSEEKRQDLEGPAGDYPLLIDGQGRFLIHGNRLRDLEKIFEDPNHTKLNDDPWVYAFARDASRLFTSNGGGEVRAWDLSLENPISERLLQGGQDAVFSPQARWICIANRQVRQLFLYPFDSSTGHVGTPTVLDGYEPHKNFFDEPRFSPDERWLAVREANSVNLWDLSAADIASQKLPLKGHEDKVVQVIFSPDSKLAITTSEGNTTCIFDLEATQGDRLLRTIEHDATKVYSVAVSPDSRLLSTATWDEDGIVRFWDLEHLRKVATDVPLKPVLELSGISSANVSAFSPDGRYWLSGNAMGEICCVDLGADGELSIRRKNVFRAALTSLEITGNSATFLGWDKTARLLDLANAENLNFLEFQSRTAAFDHCGLSQDSRVLAASSQDGLARVWRTAEPDQHIEIDTQGAAVDISPDGRWLLGGGADVIRLYDLDAENELERIKRLCGRELTTDERNTLGLSE